ncbi:MAG: hypothetical protein PF694_09075 [Bacteroidetes bacterium]|jgi:hypothetical protein|nr:hypothetical protein [Bacteroidota bacterium]
MKAYHELLQELGFKEVTLYSTKTRTNQVRDYDNGEFAIILDGINLHLLQDGTGILNLPLTDSNICLAVAYASMPEKTRKKYLLEDVRKYSENLPEKPGDKLQEKMMELMFDLGNIRQNTSE